MLVHRVSTGFDVRGGNYQTLINALPEEVRKREALALRRVLREELIRDLKRAASR